MTWDDTRETPAAPRGCTRPELGRSIEAYLRGVLGEEQREEFERHYFECAACLAAVQLRHDLARVLGDDDDAAAENSPPIRGERGGARMTGLPWWGWAAGAGAVLAAGLLALALLLPFFRVAGPHTAGETPFVLRLEGTLRDTAPRAEAPAGRDLVLLLEVPVPATSVVYDVEVARRTGQTVLAAGDVAPSGPSEVRVSIPRGKLRPGAYEVTLREVGPEEPLVLHFDFEIKAAEE